MGVTAPNRMATPLKNIKYISKKTQNMFSDSFAYVNK